MVVPVFNTLEGWVAPNDFEIYMFLKLLSKLSPGGYYYLFIFFFFVQGEGVGDVFRHHKNHLRTD